MRFLHSRRRKRLYGFILLYAALSHSRRRRRRALHAAYCYGGSYSISLRRRDAEPVCSAPFPQCSLPARRAFIIRARERSGCRSRSRTHHLKVMSLVSCRCSILPERQSSMRINLTVNRKGYVETLNKRVGGGQCGRTIKTTNYIVALPHERQPIDCSACFLC